MVARIVAACLVLCALTSCSRITAPTPVTFDWATHTEADYWDMHPGERDAYDASVTAMIEEGQ